MSTPLVDASHLYGVDDRKRTRSGKAFEFVNFVYR